MSYLRAFGPVFDGRWMPRLVRLDADLTAVVGREAKNRIVGHMALTQRQPTPYLWTTITTSPIVGGTRVYGRENLSYEAWIEGTGSRNYPVTRFRGYRAFATVAGSVPGWFGSVVQPTVTRAVRDLNGGA